MQKDKPAAIRIEVDGTHAKLIVDGAELQDRISEYTLVHQAGKVPKLYVTFNAIDVSVNGDSFIQIPESIRQLFEKNVTSPAATELVDEKDSGTI